MTHDEAYVSSEPLWHRRFLVLEDALWRTGHHQDRADHHAQVCPLCTALRTAREVGGGNAGAHPAVDDGREADNGK